MEEHIKKLKQLDRIELRIRGAENNNGFYFGVLLVMTMMIITLVAVSSIALMSLENDYPEGIDDAKEIVIFGVIISSIITILFIGVYLKEWVSIQKEYFDVVVKK